MSKIKCWTIIDNKENRLTVESSPNFGRYWIFQTREQAREELKNRFWSPRGLYKIIKIEIKY